MLAITGVAMASVNVSMVMEDVLLLASSPDPFLRMALIIIKDYKRPPASHYGCQVIGTSY